MRRLFEALAGARRPHHHIRLGSPVLSNILWWHTFMAEWNGVRIIPHPALPSSIFSLAMPTLFTPLAFYIIGGAC